MDIRRLEQIAQRSLRRAAEARHGFLLSCGLLAFLGTITVAYPVSGVVIPAALIQPRRWIAITIACAIGSAIGATALVEMVHLLGHATILGWLPRLAESPDWQAVMQWVTDYGLIGLFLLAASPFPQTPALIFFGLAEHQTLTVLIAMLFGKLLKYGLLAWLSSHFPDRFSRWNISPNNQPPPGDTP